jgi:hypothetical protein
MLLQVQWGNKGTTEEGAKLKRAKVTLHKRLLTVCVAARLLNLSLSSI